MSKVNLERERIDLWGRRARYGRENWEFGLGTCGEMGGNVVGMNETSGREGRRNNFSVLEEGGPEGEMWGRWERMKKQLINCNFYNIVRIDLPIDLCS